MSGNPGRSGGLYPTLPDDSVLVKAPQPPTSSHNVTNYIDLTTPAGSPATGSAAAKPAGPPGVPKFGVPTQIQSSFAKKDKSMFYVPKNGVRPEHHRDHKIPVPQAPTLPAIKKQPMQMYSTNWWNDLGPPEPRPQPMKPAFDAKLYPEVWTDPKKANEDLKALLEGGMDDEDDEDENGAKKESEAAQADDKEAGKVEGIKVRLLPHQEEGVEWMRGRELGPVKRGKVPKGGILADDMGLGKTLQSITLILTNQKPKSDDKAWKKHYEHVERSTLVVAPLALIRQWEQEIKEKVSASHRLSVLVHHGANRTKRSADLTRYDVVITTYQTLVSEHASFTPPKEGEKAKPAKDSQDGCFGVRWWRIILDEAHTIKNRNAKCTKACNALESEYRWCLTGTPMQNNREELQSLIQFLRIAPYNDIREWKEGIEAPFRNGRGHIAIRRLHSVLRCFMKRRTKDILKEEGALNPGGKQSAPGEESKTGFKITERKVVTVSVAFSPAERKFYNKLEARTDKSIENMMKGRVNYANALVLLLRLRQACNHPKLTEKKLENDKDALSTEPSQKSADVDDLADMLAGTTITAKSCDICGCDIANEDRKLGRSQCKECLDDLKFFMEQDAPAERKTRKSRKSIVKKIVEEKVEVKVGRRRRPRNRNAIIDSDDEEADASWIVAEDKRGPLRLGKAGGQEDEDAEGGGEWIKDDDSEDSRDGDESSQYESFVVGERSVIESPAVSQTKESKEDEDGADTDYSEDEDSGVSESEVDSYHSEDDDDDLEVEAPRKTQHIFASAKIRELIKIVLKEVQEHKFIVFSQFTSMLDLVEPFFKKEGIKFARYDGSMKNDQREANLNRLRNDRNTRVLLCSLKCGSLGLNLTAATRVVILEPFWNPVGDQRVLQAVSRVHC